MKSIAPEITIKKSNPFKFLDAYKKKEADHFFGRLAETAELLRALQKSYLVVLYGPSGSGKSSIINCGLLNKLNINEDKVFEIRRRNIGIIPTIAEALQEGIQKKNQDTFSEQFVEQFKGILTAIKESKLNIAQANEEIDELDRAMVSQKSAYQNEEISKEVYRKLIIENGEAVAEKEGAIKKNKGVKATKEKEFKAFFKQFTSYFNSPPVFIFDQFEELFTNGQPEELDEFGTFLHLIYSNHFPIKTLLSLREEYFSKLSQLENYLPQILYRRCLVDNPSEETVELILRKSFERFNINQLGVGKELIETDRIEKIVQKLGGGDSQRHRFYLPFLQIYMYKLYEEDFKRTYPNGITESTPINKYGYPSIELLESEINNFGDINAILRRYIIDIDKSLQKELGTLTRGEEIGNTVIRFLREFAYSEHTKRRIKIKPYDIGEKPNKFEIEDPNILNGLRKSIGTNINTHQINTILTALIGRRLLKPTSDNYLELSHDILARVINEFPIKESNTELLEARFNNYYTSYINNECQESDYLDDSTIEVLKENNLIDYILATETEEEERKEKKIYWDTSVKVSKEKRRAEIEKKEKQIKKLRWLSLAMFGALLFALVGLGLFGVASFKNQHHQGVIEHQKKEGAMKGQVYEGTANAFNKVKVNRTEAIKTIEESEGAYDSAFGSLFKSLNVPRPKWYKKMMEWLNLSGMDLSSTKPTLIDDFKNDLYINLHNNPFYSQQIALKEADKSPIIYTKYLTYPSNPDSVLIFFLTDKKILYQAITDYTVGGKESIAYEPIADNISAFEPYWEADNQFSLLLVREDKLYRKRSNQEEWVKLKDDFVTIEGARFLARYKNRFVSNYQNNIIEFKVNEEGLYNMKIVLNNSREIESFQQLGPDNYLIVFRNDYYFIRNEGSVKWLTKRIQHKHADGIASMDRIKVDGKLNWLLGSYDRTASLWIGGKEKKQLIGHSDKILKISFLDRANGKYVMTASADGTIKIWNLTAMDRANVMVKEANKIEQLKYDSIDSRLYAGFTFSDYQNPLGYLVSFCDSLSENCRVEHFQQKTARDNKGHITSFDFGKDNILLVGGHWNKLVTPTDDYKNKEKRIRIRENGNGYPTIKAIATQDTSLAMATKNGLYYFPNYFKDPVKEKAAYMPLDTLKGQNFNSVTFHPTKPLILATAENSNIYLWNIDNKELTILSDHLDKVRDAEFSKDGNWIISGSWDNTAILWHWENEQYVKKENFLEHTNDIEDVEFYGNDLFLTASSDYTVRVFENKDGTGFKPIPSLIRHDHKITAATFSGDGQYIYSGDARGNIKKWAFREFECDIKKRLGIVGEHCK